MKPIRKLIFLKYILKEPFEERVAKVNWTHTFMFVNNLMVNSSFSSPQTLVLASLQWWVYVEREIIEKEKSLFASYF